MTPKELLSYYKFFKGEKSNPYAPNSLPFKWWEGEKMLFEHNADDKSFWERIVGSLKKAIKERLANYPLTDESISIEQRAIYYYLDLWNGKNFPYDSLDDIFEYIKAE